jgi:hypothetical protein
MKLKKDKTLLYMILINLFMVFIIALAGLYHKITGEGIWVDAQGSLMLLLVTTLSFGATLMYSLVLLIRFIIEKIKAWIT